MRNVHKQSHSNKDMQVVCKDSQTYDSKILGKATRKYHSFICHTGGDLKKKW